MTFWFCLWISQASFIQQNYFSCKSRVIGISFDYATSIAQGSQEKSDDRERERESNSPTKFTNLFLRTVRLETMSTRGRTDESSATALPPTISLHTNPRASPRIQVKSIKKFLPAGFSIWKKPLEQNRCERENVDVKNGKRYDIPTPAPAADATGPILNGQKGDGMQSSKSNRGEE